MDFLNRGRWFFDPERGLQRSCKCPQKSDTALRKFWTKERLETEKASSPEPEEIPRSEEPKQLKPVNAKTKGKVAKKDSGAPKAKAGGRKRGRKPKVVVVESESESDESEPGHKTHSPSPKRSRRKDPVSSENNLAKSLKSPSIAEKNEVKPRGILGGTSVPDPLPIGSLKANIGAAPAVDPSGLAPVATTSVQLPPSSPSAMFQMFMSMAYDSATINARMIEVTRREKECERREQLASEAAIKSDFMSQVAKAAQSFFRTQR